MGASSDLPVLVFPPDSPHLRVEDAEAHPPREPRPPRRPRLPPKPTFFELLFDLVFVMIALASVFAFSSRIVQDETGLHVRAGEGIVESWLAAAGLAATARAAPAAIDAEAQAEPADAAGGDAAAAPAAEEVVEPDGAGVPNEAADRTLVTASGQEASPGWLVQAALAGAHRGGGLAAVVILVGLLLALTYGLLAVFLQGRGVHPLLAAGAVLVAAMLGSGHWAAAPWLFVFLGSVLLMLLLTGRGWWNLAGIALLFAAWANVGAGLWFGLGVLGLVLVGSVLELRQEGEVESWAQRVGHYALALPVALLATLANPSGWRVHEAALDRLLDGARTVGSDAIMGAAVSPLHAGILVFLLLVVLGVAALREERLPYPTLLVLVATVGLALTTPGYAAVFALVGLPLLLVAHAGATDAGDPFLPRAPRRRPTRPEDEFPQGWIAAALTAFLVFLAATAGSFAGIQIVRNDFDRSRFPVEAVFTARAAGAFDVVCSDPAWSGYLAYAWPVNAPARAGNDEPRPAPSLAHLECPDHYLLLRERRDRLAASGVDLVVVPASTWVASELTAEHGWRIWYVDRVAALLVPADRDDLPEPRSGDDPDPPAEPS